VQNIASSDEEFLNFPARETRVYMTIGYILRAIPYINFIGALLTAIGWFKLGGRTGKRNYYIAFVASIILFAMTLYSLVVSAPSFYTAFNTPSTQMPFAEIKRQLLEAARSARREMSDPLIYGSDIIMGISILVEVAGVRQLVRDTRRIVPGYLSILFIILGILYVVEGFMYPLLVPGVDNAILLISSAESYRDIVNALYSLVLALLPLLLIAITIFIVGLLTYILFGYKYWKIYDRIARIKALLSAREEAEGRGEESELI
jgi:hypothetical protein